MSNEHKPINDYSWIGSLPNWSKLAYRDVLKIFGYVSVNALSAAVTRGLFPKPDFQIKLQNKRGRPRVFWAVSTIKKEIKRRKLLETKNVSNL